MTHPFSRQSGKVHYPDFDLVFQGYNSRESSPNRTHAPDLSIDYVAEIQPVDISGANSSVYESAYDSEDQRSDDFFAGHPGHEKGNGAVLVFSEGPNGELRIVESANLQSPKSSRKSSHDMLDSPTSFRHGYDQGDSAYSLGTASPLHRAAHGFSVGSPPPFFVPFSPVGGRRHPFSPVGTPVKAAAWPPGSPIPSSGGRLPTTPLKFQTPPGSPPSPIALLRPSTPVSRTPRNTTTTPPHPHHRPSSGHVALSEDLLRPL
eukprot:Rmarinus@m.17500